MVREVLEGIVSPTVATAVLFEALEESHEAPPETLEDMRRFARGPLGSAVRRKVRSEEAAAIVERVETLFARAAEAESLSVEIVVDSADVTATAQLTVVKSPVPVLVLSGVESFARRLEACLGRDRIATTTVQDAGGLTRAVFAEEPIFVLVDATEPVPIDEVALTGALLRLPDSTTPVIWGSESRTGQDLIRRAERDGVNVVPIARADGIEPLLDLVLSRYAG